MTSCTTDGCPRQPAWPSVRRSLTWCQPCLAELCRERGFEPVEPLGAAKDRWLLRHIACGRKRHSNLATVRKSVPVCPHCRWTEWAADSRERVLPAYQRAISAAWAAGDIAAVEEFVGAYVQAYVWPAERVGAVFASAGAELLEEPADGDGLDPLSWRCSTCGYVDAMPPERMMLEAKASWKVCHACDQRRLHHDAPVIAAYFRDRHLTLVDPTASGRDRPHDAHCDRCGTARRVSVESLAAGAAPCLRCDGRRLDPDAEHRVYLFEFAHLRAFKVGITHTADDHRLTVHRANGGVLVDIVTVPDRGTAFLVERLVLDAYSAHRADVGPAHFPRGGWTECWDVLAGRPHLAEVYARASAGLGRRPRA